MGKVRQGHPRASSGAGTIHLGQTVWGSDSSSSHDFGNKSYTADDHTKAGDEKTVAYDIYCTPRFLAQEIRKPHL